MPTSWCKVTITYGPTGYTQNYKRDIRVHSDPLSQQFNRDAMADALARINAHLPVGHLPNPVTSNLLGILNQGDQIDTDPGSNFRAI